MSDNKVVRKWVRTREHFKDGRKHFCVELRSGQPSAITQDLVTAVDKKIREDQRFSISTLLLEFPNIMEAHCKILSLKVYDFENCLVSGLTSGVLLLHANARLH